MNPTATAASTIARAVRFTATEVTADGTFEGYASVFNVVNDHREIVLPGAFVDTLAEHQTAGTRVKGLWQHRTHEPIIVWDDLSEDSKGLRTKGRLVLDVARAREALALMKAGAIDGLSIGFAPIVEECLDAPSITERYGIVPDGPGNARDQYVLLHKCWLGEISLVTFPSCGPATVDTVRRKPAAAPPAADIERLARAIARRDRLIAGVA